MRVISDICIIAFFTFLSFYETFSESSLKVCRYINPVCLHDGIRLKVGRLLHEAPHQQHGFAFSLETARICQGLIFRETLSHTLLQDNQSLVDIALMTFRQTN